MAAVWSPPPCLCVAAAVRVVKKVVHELGSALLRYTPKMSNARVSRALYRSILKEIRSLTLAKGRRVLLLEEPDHRKWGHGQVDGCFA